MQSKYVYITLSVTVAVVWLYFIYTPYHQETEQIKTTTLELEKQLADFNHTVAQLPVYLERMNKLKLEKQNLTSKLFTKSEVLSLFGSLKEKADSRSLEVREITPPVEELLKLNRQMPDSTQPQFLTIGIRLQGSFIDLSRFVRDLELSPFFRGLERCQINGNRDENEPLALYVSFKALLGSYRG